MHVSTFLSNDCLTSSSLDLESCQATVYFEKSFSWINITLPFASDSFSRWIATNANEIRTLSQCASRTHTLRRPMNCCRFEWLLPRWKCTKLTSEISVCSTGSVGSDPESGYQRQDGWSFWWASAGRTPCLKGSSHLVILIYQDWKYYLQRTCKYLGLGRGCSCATLWGCRTWHVVKPRNCSSIISPCLGQCISQKGHSEICLSDQFRERYT